MIRCPKGETNAVSESTCDDQEHTALRQGRERAEHVHGWQRCGGEELRDELGRPSSRSDAVQRDSSLEDQLIALLCEWLSIKQLPIADRIREQHFHRVITPMV